MVFYKPLSSNLTTLFKDLDDLFYNLPKDSKPPMIYDYIYDQESNKPTGVKIQVAVAGYKEEDLEVFFEKECLHIYGNNTERKEVLGKFKSSFKKVIPVSSSLNLEEASVVFFDGILEVTIPAAKPPKKNLLKIFSK